MRISDWSTDVCSSDLYGGAMCVATLRTAAEGLGVDIPIRTVTATRGKVVRAQPVAALAAQGRWHMAGVFEELEDQLATWYPELGWSPDRLDAMVRSEEHTSELQSLMRISYSVFCLKKKKEKKVTKRI